MHLKNLKLLQFKNYAKAEFQFSPEINCLVGKNGSGKTNILDAIHYLCLTKSAINGADSLAVQHGLDFFTLMGDFEREGKSLQVRCVVESGKKKQLLQNGKAIEKMSEHVGLLPIVLIAPDDTRLISEGSEDRRRFFDSMLCQLDRQYMDQLVRYQHFLKQRNALIKLFADKGKWQEELMEPYNRELIQGSKVLAAKRQAFVDEYSPLLVDYYSFISDAQEPVSISYETQCLEEDFDTAFRAAASKDFVLKRSTTGIHKDDFVFQIGGYPIKKFGSQGQQKSFVIGLKLAQFQVFHAHLQVKPLLLLDDIFDKLDDGRISQLMKLVADHAFGQLFITDARPERSKEILKGVDAECVFFEVGPAYHKQ